MRIEQIRARASEAMAQIYAPREVLIRTDGRVKYVVLSRNRQIAASLAVGGLVLGLVTLSIGWSVTGHRLGLRSGEVETARSAYVELLAEVSQYYDEFATLARNMEANESALLGLVKGNSSDSLDVGAIEAQLAHSQLVRAEGLAGSAGLRDKLRLFETDLRNVASRNDQLTANIALLQDRLNAAEAEKRAMLELRDTLQAELQAAQATLADSENRRGGLTGTIAGLEKQVATLQHTNESGRQERNRLTGDLEEAQGQLAAAETRNSELGETITSLEEQMATMQLAGESERVANHTLLAEVARLETQLGSALRRGRSAERQLTETQRQLEALRNQRESLVSMRDGLSNEVESLQGHIAAMELSQQTIVRRLAERTRSGADEVEKTVAMTGLDVDALLLKVTAEMSGLGGPFVPVRGRAAAGDVQTVLASVAPLDLEMSRWEKLQLVLRSMPLNPPLDHYTVGSTYGTRKDPLNSKLAMHEGLDFGAPLGSSVLATAPGTVVFAGRKGSYGRLVEIDHGFGIRTRYAHLKSILVEVGQTVGYRDRIGKLGTSGRSTGPHVHYEILVDGKPYDPMNFLKAGRYVFKG